MGAGRCLAHVDLYRVESREELELVGFADLIGPGAVVAVEWGDRFPEALPRDRLEIAIRRPDFERDPAGRVLDALCYGAVSEAALTNWRAALAARF
jgi:tRNA threonylcarbamoyladenosine biosynthesis protein TsaE